MSASAEPSRTCQRCGAPLKQWARGSVCWGCMMSASASIGTGSAGTSATVSEPESELSAAAKRFGDYLLEKEIAHGGMGVVYRARQISLDRPVAVKLLLLGRYSSAESIERFRREAQAAAALRHPNIVAVHEVGECEGQRYFSMELVEGNSLAEVLRAGPLSPARAVEITGAITEAIHYAHEHGVLHRDLKPSNVLIDALGQVRVTDFGLAKKLDGSSDLTATGQMVGTPNYLSPEQAAGRNAEVGPASDVYSLGALLYELLTGRPPFLADSLQDTLLRIRDADPVAPRALNPALPRDLETICLKCLEKSPARRYPTARALADDLRRWQRSEPIEARPVSALERVAKWVGRHPWRAGGGAALVLMFLVGFAGVTWQWQRAEHERQRVIAEQEATRRSLYASDMFGASQALNQGNLGLVRTTLERWKPGPGTPDLRGVEWHCLAGLARGDQLRGWTAHSNMVVGLAFSPDGRWLASASRDRTVKLWDAASGEPVHTFTGFSNVLFTVSFSADGARLAAGGWEVAHVWDTASRQLVFARKLDLNSQLRGANPQVRLVFSPADANLLALGVGASDSALPQGGEVVLWNLKSGAEHLLAASGGRPAFSRNGRWIATGGTETSCKVWDSSGALRQTLECGANVIAVEFLGDGPLLVCSTWDGELQLWNGETGTKQRVLRGPGLRQRALAVSRDGARVATGGVEQQVEVWPLPDAASPVSWRGHGNEIWSLAFSPDGRMLASGDKSGAILLWNGSGPTGGEELTEVQLAPAGAQTLWPWAVGKPVVSPDSRLLAAARVDGGVGVWAVDGLRLVATLPRERIPLAFSPDSRVLLTLNDDPVCRLWEATNGVAIGDFPFTPGWDFEHATRLSPTAETLAIGLRGGITVLWDPLSARRVGIASNTAWSAAMAFSPDGARLLTGTSEGTCQLFDVPSRRVIAALPRHRGRVLGAAFAPDGPLLATGGADNLIRLWSADTQSEYAQLAGHRDAVTCVAFSADGRTLASGGNDRMVRLWHRPTLRELGAFAFQREVTFVGFSPRGDLLLIGEGNRGPLHLWRTGASAVGGDVKPAVASAALPERWTQLVQASRTNLAAKRRLPLAPSRDRRLRPQLLDLSAHFNAAFDETWAVWDHANDLSDFAPGLRRLGGVEFDVRGVVVLGDGSDPRRPDCANGIRVNLDCRRIHFLHAANLVGLDYKTADLPAGTEVARYVMHFQDGTREDKPVVLGRDVWNWHILPEAAQARNPSAPRAVWTSANFISRANGLQTALFLSTWTNPRPEARLDRIDFVSARTKAEPFLLGITVE